MPALTQEQVALLKDNHYKTLNIPQTATEAEIRTAFRKLALKHHPDRHANADGGVNTTGTSTTTNEKKGHEEFIKIKTAYDTLSNPQTRAAYDSKLRLAQSIHATPYPPSTYTTPAYFHARPSYVRKPSTNFPTTTAFEAHLFAERQKREQQDRERSQRTRKAADESLRKQQETKIRLEREARQQAELRRSWEAARKRRSAQASVPPIFPEPADPNTTPPFIPPHCKRPNPSDTYSDTSTDGSSSPTNDPHSSTSPPLDSDLEEIEELEAEAYLERKRQRHRDFQKLMADREASFAAQQRAREVRFRREQEALQRSFDRGDPIPTIGSPPSPPTKRPTPVPRATPTFSTTSRPRETARPTPMDTDPEPFNPFFGAQTVDLDQEIQLEFQRMQQVHEQLRRRTEGVFGSVFSGLGGLGL